jgi:hypothetical protein
VHGRIINVGRLGGEASAALDRMAANAHFGRIMLTVGG